MNANVSNEKNQIQFVWYEFQQTVFGGGAFLDESDTFS